MKNGSYTLLGHTIVFSGSSWVIVRDGDKEPHSRVQSFQMAVLRVLELVGEHKGTSLVLTKSQVDQALSCVRHQIREAYGHE